MSSARARPFPFPIVDHHAHLRPGASSLEAGRRFRDEGGTHLFLATQNYLPRPPRTLAEYREQFAETERIAQALRSELGLSVHCVLSPYPIDLVHVAPEIGLGPAEELQAAALACAAKEVAEGRAVAIGEMGLAHFPVPPDVAQALERVFALALSTARETGCPAVLHTGDLDAEGYRQVAERVRKSGLDPGKAVKHYAKGGVAAADRGGITPSFLARRETVKEALREPSPWFLETDFLDDPARPGVALPLQTVPRRVHAAAQLAAERGVEDWAEAWRVPFVEAPRRVYGLELSRERPLHWGAR